MAAQGYTIELRARIRGEQLRYGILLRFVGVVVALVGLSQAITGEPLVGWVLITVGFGAAALGLLGQKTRDLLEVTYRRAPDSVPTSSIP